MVTGPSGKRSIFPDTNAGVGVADEEGLEEMVKGASVLRKKAEAPATDKLPFDAARRVNYSDYGLPPLGFLNEAPPPNRRTLSS